MGYICPECGEGLPDETMCPCQCGEWEDDEDDFEDGWQCSLSSFEWWVVTKAEATIETKIAVVHLLERFNEYTYDEAEIGAKEQDPLRPPDDPHLQ